LSVQIAFLSPEAATASSPHQSIRERADEHLCSQPTGDPDRSRADHVSRLPVIVHRDDGEEPRRGKLLAMHELRRGVERHARAQESRRTAMVTTRLPVIRELLELIEALDRRVPQVQRAGEEAIAREAAALKIRALKRIAELESRSNTPATRPSPRQPATL
jgi:hypothetical protein